MLHLEEFARALHAPPSERYTAALPFDVLYAASFPVRTRFDAFDAPVSEGVMCLQLQGRAAITPVLLDVQFGMLVPEGHLAVIQALAPSTRARHI